MRGPVESCLALAMAGRCLALWLVLVAMALPDAAAAQGDAPSPFQPALTVNDEPVTWYDIDQRMRLLRFSGAGGGDDLQQRAVDQLIEDRLRLQAGRRLGVTVDETQDDRLIADFAANNNVPVARIEEGLRQSGVARETLVGALAAQNVWREVIRARYRGLAEPSALEVDQAVALAAAGRNTEYLLSEIVIPLARRGEAETRALAEDLSRELDAGGDFAAAARRFSASASAAQGGDIGWVPEAALPPVVSIALAETETGRVTAPLEAGGAVALLRVRDRRRVAVEGADGLAFELLAISARDDDPVAAIARLDAVIARGPTCADGEALAREAGLEARRGEPTGVAAMPEAVREAVIDRAPGEIAGPVPTQGGAAAFVVCARTEGVPPEVRERIAEQLRQERFQRFANAFLQELRGDAVIERR